NEDVFEQGFTKLTQNVMNTTKLTASSMEGTIDVKQDGLFYTSIPYEKGWTAVVDGQKVDVSAVGNAMLAFPISQGEHTIKLYYYPNGFWPGFAVTMVCILIFAALCFLIYVKKKKPIPEPAKLDIPEPDEE
ncbi:MAG: YfhO family protein, partial [Oscillospiraceae bacterium]|nr:YfhO family protein [Oscillospiraceae bacterium]